MAQGSAKGTCAWQKPEGTCAPAVMLPAKMRWHEDGKAWHGGIRGHTRPFPPRGTCQHFRDTPRPHLEGGVLVLEPPSRRRTQKGVA